MVGDEKRVLKIKRVSFFFYLTPSTNDPNMSQSEAEKHILTVLPLNTNAVAKYKLFLKSNMYYMN